MKNKFPGAARRACNGLVVVAPMVLASLLAEAHAQEATPAFGIAQGGTPPAAAEPVATPRFDVFEYRVEGNTVLDAEAIERAVYPHLGERRSLEDVESARTALEKAYRDAGFATVAVDIPEQRIDAGVVRLQVVQGEVSRLRVTGSRYFSQNHILARVPAVAEGSVPNVKVLQAQLGTVNRTADRRVTPMLRPGKEPGTTEVDLTVEDKPPWHGSLELNNHASPNTSATRLQGSLSHENLWQLDHTLALQAQVSPQQTSDVQVLSANYGIPIGTDTLSFSLTRSNSNVAAGVAGTTVFGKGTIYGVRRNVLLDVNERGYQLLTLGADLKVFKETIDFGGAVASSTPIRYVPASLAYAAGREDPSGRWQGGLTFITGVRSLSDDDARFDDKRANARGNFAVLKFDLSREQKLPADLRLVGKAELQFASQPLISNEQFSAGGADSVRGYQESAAVGDDALRASLELRSPELVPEGWARVTGLKVHVFAEGAMLRLQKPLPGQTSRFNLLGAGFGLQLATRTFGGLSVDLGWPLHDAGRVRRSGPRLHAAGRVEF